VDRVAEALSLAIGHVGYRETEFSGVWAKERPPEA